VHVVEPSSAWTTTPLTIVNPRSGPAYASVLVHSPSFPSDGSLRIEFADQLLFQHWQESAGEVQGGTIVSGTKSVQLDLQDAGNAPEKVIDAIIGHIPLGPDDISTIELDVLAPSETHPLIDVRQQIDGQDVGGVVYGPPIPLRLYLPMSMAR
jgi:hypothetical protein